MHKPILASLVSIAAIGLHAQTVSLTPQNLDQWNVVGADKGAMARESVLSIPAGAQLDHFFGPGALVLRVVSRPTFAEASADQPILGVGPVAVAFERKETNGRFILIIGKNRLIDLPWSVPLDSSGTSVDLLFGYDPAAQTGLISWQGEVHTFNASDTPTSVEVWLAAGERNAWPLDTVEIFALPADQAEAGAKLGSDALGNAKVARLQGAALKLREAPGHANVSANRPDLATDAADSARPNGPNVAPPEPPTLEIFTPPSVRQRGKSGEHARKSENL